MLKLRRPEVTIRGDNEASLQALIRAVAERCGQHGVKVFTEGTKGIDSQQSLGAAERMHDTIAGQVRTMVGVLKERIGIDIIPGSRLFAWLVRHAIYIVAHFRVRHEGLTPIRALTGAECSDKLCEFAEVVLFKTVKPPGKSVPRWEKGVWVGINENNRAHVILTDDGYESTRDVSRLIEAEQWDADFLQKVCGLPCSRTDGVDSRTRAAYEKSGPIVVSVPGNSMLLHGPATELPTQHFDVAGGDPAADATDADFGLDQTVVQQGSATPIAPSAATMLPVVPPLPVGTAAPTPGIPMPGTSSSSTQRVAAPTTP